MVGLVDGAEGEMEVEVVVVWVTDSMVNLISAGEREGDPVGRKVMRWEGG